MRILDLGEFYSERGGGVRSYLGGLLAASALHGHEVTVVAPGPSDSDELVPGGRIVRYRAPRMPYDRTYHVPYRLARMRSLIMELSPDVLQISSPYLPWLAARDMRAPVRSYVYHSDPINAYAEPFAEQWLPRPMAKGLLHAAWSWMRTVCHSCDMTVVAGEWLRTELLQRGITGVECVPFGIEHRGFGRERRTGALRAQLLGANAAAKDARIVGIVGRLALEKRQSLLIDAAAALARSRPITVLVLGDGPERERLRARAAQHGLPCHFWPFTHDREQYAEVLASLDVLLHGSRAETYGFVLVEALASGTPVVVPAQGGAAHVGDAACCETYPRDAGAREIAAAALRVLERGRDVASPAACAAAARHPSRATHFSHLFELYRAALERRRDNQCRVQEDAIDSRRGRSALAARLSATPHTIVSSETEH